MAGELGVGTIEYVHASEVVAADTDDDDAAGA